MFNAFAILELRKQWFKGLPDGAGTVLTFTEMTAYFGEGDAREQDVSRIRGTQHHFDGLVKLMEG